MVLADSFYYQPVQIDTINTRVNADLFAKEGDANGRGMVVQITENGIIKDTTGIELRLQWSHLSVGVSGFTDFEVVDATKGLYKLKYPTSMLHRGRVEAFIRITDNGVLSGTRNLLITVERMVGSDETIEASDDFSALQTALTSLSSLEATISGKVDTWEADMEATKQLYIDTLSAAEAAYPQELVSLQVQLADMTTLLKNRVNANVSIATQFPSVTLAQVQAVNATATLSDSSDWYVVQSFINFCVANNIKKITIPEGIYYMSRGIELGYLQYGSFLTCEGVIFKAVAPMNEMVLIKHHTNYWKGRRVTIIGLEIRGDYKTQKGVSVSGAQEWYLQAVRIHGCFIGLYLEDTWYGEMSGESIIQDCLTGIDFGGGTTYEVNTIGFYNVKLNFAVPKTSFYPKNVGETDADYNLRVRSIGVTLGIILGGIDFTSITVEGYEYGFKYIPKEPGTGSNSGIFSITASYFEAISKKYFDFSEATTSGYRQAVYKLKILNTRFHTQTGLEPSVFSEGFYEFTGNQNFSISFIHGAIRSRISAVLDDSVTLTNTMNDDEQLYIRYKRMPTSATARFLGWDSSNIYPDGENMVPTIGHASYQYTPSMQQIRGDFTGANNSKLFDAYSIMSRPIVFLPAYGGKNGPVIKGDDGKWYMLQVNASGVYTKEIVNLFRIDESVNAKSARELHYLTASEVVGTTYRCIDLDGVEVRLTMYNGVKKWCRNGLPVIDTTSNLRTLVTLLNYNIKVVDVSTGQINIAKEKTHYRYVDWFGLPYSYTSIGPIASRPATAEEGFIYYATDESRYYKYANGAYIAFTPYVI